MLTEGTQILAGRYKLLAPLKRGGMGNLWTAEHLTLHSRVAIKLLDDELLQRPDAVTRFVREARAAATIRSPHIVQILDVGVEQGIPFIAMELLQGESLAERIERVGALTPAETSRILTQVARGLTRAHGAGLVHRDLKPSNVFLERNEEEENVKILDFGVAKALVPGFDTESGATRTGALIGSPHYMSPEQAEASDALDHRTDVWAFGVVAFECLTGKRPFDQVSLGSQLLAICAWSMPVPSQVASVPVGFDAWFARACARPLDERFASVHEAAHELRLVCEDSQRTSAPRSEVSQSVRRPLPSSGTRRGVELARSAPPAWAGLHARAWVPWLAAALVIGLIALAFALREPDQVATPKTERTPGQQDTLVPDRPISAPAPAATLPAAAPAPQTQPPSALQPEPPVASMPGHAPKPAGAKAPAAPKAAKQRSIGSPVTLPLPPFKEDPY